jgi:hypothetical protein
MKSKWSSEYLEQIPMNRVLPVIAMTSAILLGERGFAVDSITQQPTMNKRQTIVQIVGCMKKRMAATKTISYNEAVNACKDQIHKRSDNSSSDTLVESDAPAKP